MLQWNIVCATPRRHVLRIFDRELEVSFEARITHAVSAFQLCCFVDRQLLVHANHTRNARIKIRPRKGLASSVVTDNLSEFPGGGMDAPKKLPRKVFDRLVEEAML